MVRKQIYKKLEDFTLEPSPMTWNRIQKNIKSTPERSQFKTFVAVAASFLVLTGFTLIYASLYNSYQIELVDMTENNNQDYNIYNIELSNKLTRAYQGNLN